MLKSDSIIKIMPALVKAQSEMSQPKKDSANPFYKSKYADLASILEACQPALNANDICIIQPITRDNDKSCVETLLFHSSGEYIGCLTEIKNTKPNDPQAEGSGITYARRYGLQSLLGLSAVDDDGNKASNLVPETKTYNKPVAQVKKEANFSTPVPTKESKVTDIQKKATTQDKIISILDDLIKNKDTFEARVKDLVTSYASTKDIDLNSYDWFIDHVTFLSVENQIGIKKVGS
jgi:hypothetical protein